MAAKASPIRGWTQPRTLLHLPLHLPQAHHFLVLKFRLSLTRTAWPRSMVCFSFSFFSFEPEFLFYLISKYNSITFHGKHIFESMLYACILKHQFSIESLNSCHTETPHIQSAVHSSRGKSKIKALAESVPEESAS